jgi:hypothetical protein
MLKVLKKLTVGSCYTVGCFLIANLFVHAEALDQTLPIINSPQHKVSELAKTSVQQPSPSPSSEPLPSGSIPEQPRSSMLSSNNPVTPVSQLSDVQPTDWAYQALRSLVNRYGELLGYPDDSFHGNRPLTRHEFAIVLNMILNSLHGRSTSEPEIVITPEELIVLQRLQSEFANELEESQNRLDAFDARIRNLESVQFSPTSILTGEVIWGLAGVVNDGADETSVFQGSVELSLQTSFTGEDELEIELESGNAVDFPNWENGTLEGRLGFPGGTDEDRVELSGLSYEFPTGDQTNILIAADGDNLRSMNPFLGSSSSGTISEFGQENPIHNLVEDTGIGVEHEFNDTLSIRLGYFSGEAFDSNAGEGFFNGDYSVSAQLEFEPSDRLLFGLTYIHTYNGSDLATGTGSQQSQLELDRPIVGNSYGLTASIIPSNQFVIGGWVGFTHATVIDRGEAHVWNYALTLAFPDLGQPGNLLGVVIGQEPRLTGVEGLLSDDIRADPDVSWHIEAFYHYQITDHLSITPGFIWITAPDHNSGNPDFVVWTLRTAFEF